MTVVSTWLNDGIERFPIETAPRDGTLIYVGSSDCGEFMMRWGHTQTNALFAPGVTGMWVMDGAEMTWAEHDGFGPVLWRPIP